MPRRTLPSVWMETLNALIDGASWTFTATEIIEPTVRLALSNVAGLVQSVAGGAVTQTCGVAAWAYAIPRIWARSMRVISNRTFVFFKFVTPIFSVGYSSIPVISV